MQITIEIPEEMAQKIAAAGESLQRRTFEALVAEEYRLARLHKPDLRRILGLNTSAEIDAFLKAHQVFDDYSIDELNREAAALERLRS